MESAADRSAQGRDNDVEATRGAPRPPGSRRAPRARRCPLCAQAFSGEARFCPFDGDALVDAPDWNPSADPLLGHVIDGRYDVVSVLGEGGMGTVYEVRHVTLGRRFALKVLRRDIADAEHVARFIQEAKAAAAIGHPNIVAVSDFGELAIESAATAVARAVAQDEAPPSSEEAAAAPVSAVPYFVMEYLSGVSLAELLRTEKALDPVRAAEIALQCAAGLSAAHAAGVVHRDLKPDNVFLTRSNDREFVKLLDFGVAKMPGAGRLTRAGMVFGTPHYMSPEQAAGQPVDQRADIYALGVILYECLAGRVPFEADTYMGVLTKHMFATPEPVDRAVPDASRLGPLAPIVMRCLAKSPRDRYAGMAEVEAALERALNDFARAGGSRSLRPRRASFEAYFERTPGLRPAVGPLGIGLGALAIVSIVVLGVRELRSPRVVSAAPPPMASASAHVESARPEAATTSPAPVPQPPPAPVTTAAQSVETAAAPPQATTPQATPPQAAPPQATPAAPGSEVPKARPVSVRPLPEKKRKAGTRGGDVVDPWGR